MAPRACTKKWVAPRRTRWVPGERLAASCASWVAPRAGKPAERPQKQAEKWVAEKWVAPGVTWELPREPVLRLPAIARGPLPPVSRWSSRGQTGSAPAARVLRGWGKLSASATNAPRRRRKPWHATCRVCGQARERRRRGRGPPRQPRGGRAPRAKRSTRARRRSSSPAAPPQVPRLGQRLFHRSCQRLGHRSLDRPIDHPFRRPFRRTSHRSPPPPDRRAPVPGDAPARRRRGGGWHRPGKEP